MRKHRPDLPFLIFVALCAAAILACGAYLAYNYLYFPARVGARSAKYEELYPARATETPTPVLASAPGPTPASTAEPTATPMPTAEIDDVADVARGTPDPDTILYQIPTPPPIQESFAELLAKNPETIGYLTIGDMLSLPVVQRPNDNEFYLTHDFEGEKSDAGCLFLDGVNRLELGDELLIVYGHNMKNGTMFGALPNYEFRSVLRKNAIVYFDSLYENRAYAPFACFALTADPGDSSYVDLRRFQFAEAAFDDFVASLKERSLLDIPVDVAYGDDILLLITCNYSIDDGRFAVALRALREGESEADMRTLVGQASEK